MRLRVLSCTEVVLDQEVSHVTAEDPQGSLGIRPGHAALVTPLVPSILIAREPNGHERYAAINGGVLIVNRDRVDVVSRQAVTGLDLARLEGVVLDEFAKQAAGEQTNRAAFEKMRVSFMRQVLEFDQAGGGL